MRQRKIGLVWGLVLLIFALGYLGFHSLAASESRQGYSEQVKITNAQSTDLSKDDTTSTQSELEKKMQPKETVQSDSTSINNGEGVTVIGDSVIVGVEPYLKEKLPKATVEGKVGRQMSQAEELIQQLSTKGRLGDHIIIELGTNGPFSKDQLRSLLTSLTEAKQVLVVTTRVPKGWQDTVNSNIKEVAGEFVNAKVVDWYAASEGKDEYFYKDGVHLKPDGSRFYSSLLIQGLQEQ